MATRELWYAQSGPLEYDDTYAGEYSVAEGKWIYWYPAPYTTLPLRAALCSQIYVTDVPVSDMEVARRMDVDGTTNTLLKADATTKLPVDSAIVEDGTNVIIDGRNLILKTTNTSNLGSADVLWATVYANAFRMPTGAGAGKFIQGDADGDFSWVTHTVPTHNVLSASHTDSLTASAILGDIIHGNVTPVWARLAGNTTTTKKFLAQTGTGIISAVPGWDTIVDGDVPATHAGSAHHAAVTVSAPISLSGQALSLVNNAVSPETITAIDVGTLANSDTVIPTSKAVTTAISGAGHAAVTLSVAADVLLALSTQEIGLDTQAANLLFAGPVSGAAAAPTFRALVALDLGTTLSPSFAGLTIGSLAGVLKATAGVLAGSAVHSDLGSIGANDHHNAITLDTNADTLLSLSTQALGLDTQAMNLGFFGPVSGAAAVPTFRAMVADDLGTTLSPTFNTITITGTIKAPLGTVSAPSYRFTSDLNTGFFVAGVGYPAITAAGTFCAMFNSTGVYLVSTAGIRWSSSSTDPYNNADDTNIWREDAGVIRMGISLLSPVAQTLKAANGLGTDRPGGNLTLAGGRSTGTGAGGSLSFATSPAAAGTGVTLNNLVTAVTINSSGYVGIGTTAPLTPLELQAGLTTTGAVLTLSSKETSTVANDVLGRINFRAALDAAGTDAILTAASIAAIAENTFSSSVNETGLQFSTGASEVAVERMRIDHHGNVGIRTTAPLRALDINEASGNCLRLIYNDADGSAANYADFLVGSAGDLTITSPATKTVYFSPTVYDDMQFPVSDAKVTPNNLLPSWEVFTTNTSEYAFSVNDEVDTQANEIPHWWKQGTAGNAHMHITTKAVPAGAQYAKFTVTFAYADTDEVWVEAPLTAEKTIPISTTALTNFYLDLGDLTLTNYLVGAQIKCRIRRIAATGGTEYVGDIFVTQVGIHLEKDTLGSRQEIVK